MIVEPESSLLTGKKYLEKKILRIKIKKYFFGVHKV